MSFRLIPLAVVITVFLTAHLSAQLITGTVTGTVVDQGDAAIPGATVTVVNEGTGQTRSVTTNAVGLFRMPAIQPGMYTVRVEMKGFGTSERRQRTPAERHSMG